MGFLGFGNFDKEGPGIEKDTPKSKGIKLYFEIYFRKFWKLIPLNMMFLLFCLPVVTIGPATAGLTYVLRNYVREEHAFPYSDFFDAFKNNFKQSFVYGILHLVFLVILYVAGNFYYGFLSTNKLVFFPFVVCIWAAVTLIFMSFYAYMLIVSVDLKFKDIIKNSFILSIAGLKGNLISLVVSVVLIVLCIVGFPLSLLPAILLLPVTVWFTVCFNIYPTFERLVIRPAKEPASEKENK